MEFICNGEALQPIYAVVSEGLHKLVAICCTASCLLDMQRVQTAAKGDNLSGKIEELAAIIICRMKKVGELEKL